MRLNRFRGWLWLAALGPLLTAGCFERDRSLEHEVSGTIASGDHEITRLARERTEAASGVRIAGRPWYGSARSGQQAGSLPAVGALTGEPLPGNLERRGGIALSIPTRTSLQEAAGLISRTAGIPLSINLRLPAGEGTAATPTSAQLPELGQPIRHDGPLSALLDRIAGEYDVFWRFDGSAVAITAFDTRTWALPTMPGTTSLNTSFSGLAGGNDSVTLSRSAAIDDWQEISRLLEASINAPPAVVTVSPGIGRISVTGRPSDIAAAERIIQEAASLASHRISFEVGIYYLDADRSRDFAIGLTQFSEFDGPADEEPPTSLFASAGAISIIGAEAGPGLSYALNFEDVGRHSAVLTHRTASTVAVSGSVAPIRLVSTRNYVSSIAVSEEGQRSVQTDKVDDGIAIQIIPRLIDRETLRLSLLVGQADLLGFDVFQNVQLPRVDHRMIANDIVMAPGETLVLSGYEQGTADLRDESGLLSAAADQSVERIMLVMLVRPTLLPHHANR